jgi:hypothetical protein
LCFLFCFISSLLNLLIKKTFIFLLLLVYEGPIVFKERKFGGYTIHPRHTSG